MMTLFSVLLAMCITRMHILGMTVIFVGMSRWRRQKPWTVPMLAEARAAGRKLVMLTAYDNSFARVADANGIDLVLVGDSLRAVQLSNDLLTAGINALPIIHPAVPEGLARLRFFITSEHTEEQIRHTVTLTAEKLKELTERNFGLASVDIQQMISKLASR